VHTQDGQVLIDEAQATFTVGGEEKGFIAQKGICAHAAALILWLSLIKRRNEGEVSDDIALFNVLLQAMHKVCEENFEELLVEFYKYIMHIEDSGFMPGVVQIRKELAAHPRWSRQGEIDREKIYGEIIAVWAEYERYQRLCNSKGVKKVRGQMVWHATATPDYVIEHILPALAPLAGIINDNPQLREPARKLGFEQPMISAKATDSSKVRDDVLVPALTRKDAPVGLASFVPFAAPATGLLAFLTSIFSTGPPLFVIGYSIIALTILAFLILAPSHNSPPSDTDTKIYNNIIKGNNFIFKHAKESCCF